MIDLIRNKMKIELKEFGNKNERLILSDEHFDATGWVEVIITDTEDENNRARIDMHISDLFPALTAFKTKYDEEIKREEILKERD